MSVEGSAWCQSTFAVGDGQLFQIVCILPAALLGVSLLIWYALHFSL
jgi:hypothetical protein